MTYRPKSAFAGYKANEIMSLTPVQLILKVYDYVIVNCRKRDTDKVNAGLTQLIASLNFDYKEVSLGFFRIYRYCQTESKKGNFEEIEKHISELRSAWAQAFKLS
ncbi:MAG: flagellar protein FliS [Bacteroidetes bacterium]|nr:flagellar protein FliS [Bacteroidota bacterium]